MPYTAEEIGQRLRAARAARGLSQRELSRQAGVPQGHISRIERGAVDLRLSSLLALARILDLDLTLVPRRAAPAVAAILRGGEPAAAGTEAPRHAYSLDGAEDGAGDGAGDGGDDGAEDWAGEPGGGGDG